MSSRKLFRLLTCCLLLFCAGPASAQHSDYSALEGTWHLAAWSEGHKVMTGEMTFDAYGLLVLGSYYSSAEAADSWVTEYDFSGGTSTRLEISTTGAITGQLTTQGTTYTVNYGQMNRAKNMIVLKTDYPSNEDMFEMLLVKKDTGTTFATSDLGGDWFLADAGVTGNGASGIDTTIGYGPVTMTSAGVVSGTYNPADSTDPSVNITGTTLTIAADGSIGGTIAADGGVTLDIQGGQMDSEKRVIALVYKETTVGALQNTDGGKMVLVRKASGIAATDLSGTWNYVAIEANRNDPTDANPSFVSTTATEFSWVDVSSTGALSGGPDNNITVLGGQMPSSEDAFFAVTEFNDGGFGKYGVSQGFLPWESSSSSSGGGGGGGCVMASEASGAANILLVLGFLVPLMVRRRG